MKEKDLIDIASRHYPDGLVAGAYEADRLRVGDSLAEFVVSELSGICDDDDFPTDDEQLEVVERRMRMAAHELFDVAEGLAEARRKLAAKTGKTTARPRGRGRRVNFKKPRSKLVK